jgi:hypothetical protein
MSDYKKNLELYDAIVARNPNFERKGKTMPYTSANGHMFSLLNKDGQFGIRLPKETAAKFIKTYESGEFRSYGAVMREYVLVPDSILGNADIMDKYLQKSFEFVMSKPSK